MTYIVRNYPSEGQSFKCCVEENEIEVNSLEEARAEVRRRLGDTDTWRRWDGDPLVETIVEAYHGSTAAGGGGVEIELDADLEWDLE